MVLYCWSFGGYWGFGLFFVIVRFGFIEEGGLLFGLLKLLFKKVLEKFNVRDFIDGL